MSLDFSHKSDLQSLGRVARALQAVAEPAGVNFLLVGATARDLMLRYAHGIEPARQTADVDFAVMVSSWPSFEALRGALITSGEFFSRPAERFHQLRHSTGLPVDIVPFGGIERVNRTIAWPPDESTVLDCFGAREAFEASTWVLLPGGANVRVASIPALALLKIMAWHDRKRTYPGKDAPDLVLYLRTYMDCGNLDRAAREHADLFEVEDFDHVESGTRLLARDIARLIDRSAIERVLSILMPEADENGALLFASQSGVALEDARRLVEVLCDEFATI